MLTSMSPSLVISPVEDCPAGAGRSDVQCSLSPECVAMGGTAAGVATGAGACASLSGALVATSGSAILGGLRECDFTRDGYELGREGRIDGFRATEQNMA